MYVRPLGAASPVSNEAAGYAAVISRLQRLRTKRIVLEATGGYERALWLALNEAGLVAAVRLFHACSNQHVCGSLAIFLPGPAWAG